MGLLTPTSFNITERYRKRRKSIVKTILSFAISNKIAGVNPYHVIRQITEKDKDNWHEQLKDYEDSI